MTQYDLLTMGRSSIDLYSNDVGAEFSEIESFGAFVGGCPTNIAVGATRLGLKTAILTGVGRDPVGEFIVGFLKKEGVDTQFIPTKPGHRSSAVLLGIQPPDKFPLVYYRDNCADIELDIDDVVAAPIANSRALVVTGTGLSREPSRSATLIALERAKAAGTRTVLDLDFRLDQWGDARAFGATIRSTLSNVDIVIGTEEEVMMAASEGTAVVHDSQVSSPDVVGSVDRAIERILSAKISALALKQGSKGSTVFTPSGDRHHAPPFSVEVVNVLGAGDAFAAGFLYGMLKGWHLGTAAKMGNATGAIVVGRQGCANFMPTEREALDLFGGKGVSP